LKKALFQLHTAVFLAGFTAILGKLIGLNEGLLVWYRLLFSIIPLGIWLYFSGKIPSISWKRFRSVSGVGLILALHWVTFYASVKYANASVAVVCLSAAGFYTSLLEPVLFRRKLRWTELALGLLSLVGIYIIFDFHPQYHTGIIFGMLSSLGSALFPIYNKRLLRKHSPLTLTFFEMSGGLFFLTFILPIYFYFFRPDYYIPTMSDLGWMMILVFLCTLLAFVMQLKALTRISAFTSNLTYNLEPVYGIILAFLLLGEGKMVNGHFYWGLALIVLSIGMQTYGVVRSKKIKQ
jgi:drug/metabolite transporter (DMT)-like permease